MLKITSKIIGLEFELFQELGENEKLVYRLVGVIYLITLGLAAFAGSFLFYLIDSHFFSILLGGLIYLFIVGSTFRVLLSTNRKSIVEVGVVTQAWKKFIPSFSGMIRLYIIFIFSVIISFPLAAGMNFSVVERISEAKTQEIEQEIKSGVELLVLENIEDDIEYTHFPLSTFEELANTGRIYPWLILVFGLLLFQQVLIILARNSTAFMYQHLATQNYKDLAVNSYFQIVVSGLDKAESKYKVDLSEYRAQLLKNGIAAPPISELEQQQLVYLKDEEKVRNLLQL